MNTYLVTFHSQFAALALCKELSSAGIEAELADVPRDLSASCGICLYFSAADWQLVKGAYDLDAIYLYAADNSYQMLYQVD